MLHIRLSNCPALRLVVPFALGIFCGDYLFFEGIRLSHLSMSLFSILFLLTIGIVYKFIKRYAFRTLFGYSIFLGFLIIGAYWSNIHVQDVVVDFPLSKAVYRAVITDKPKEKEKSILCRVRLLDVPDSLASDALNGKSVLLYVAPDSIGRSMRRGDEILFSSRLSLPESKGNPDEFDYSRYLVRRGISGTAYLASGNWQVINHHTSASIAAYASDCMDRLLKFYTDLGFEGDTFAILSALTVGYKDALSDAVTESFSVTGVSHVLALSGMHIGFLYTFLLFFLNKLPHSSFFMKLVRLMVILSVLWGFAILTGLFPSVVRSVVMFSLLALSVFFTGHSISMNTLSVAALGMLLYDPGWLFDVGFQLSFIAVISILFIYPRLYKRIDIKNSCLRNLWGVAAVSIAAQIGTVPLVLLYFSRYSVHFLLTNMIVVPLTTFIIYVAIVMLLLSFLFAGSQLVTSELKFLIELLLRTVKSIESLPFASIDGIWICRIEAVLIYFIIAFFFAYSVRRNPRLLICGLGVVFLFSVYRIALIERDRPQQSIVFYNVRNCPAVHCISPNGESWIAYVDSLPDHKRLARVASNYWNRLRLSSPVVITGNYDDTYFVRHDGLLAFGGKRVYVVCDDRWKYRGSDSPLRIDFLYLCKGYSGRLEQLTASFDIEHLIMDSSLPDYRRKALQTECESLGIAYTSVSGQASYFKTAI